MRLLVIILTAFICLESTAATKIAAAREGEFKTFDPMQQNDTESSLIIAQIYSSLLTFDLLKTPKELVPDLLESMPEKKQGNLYLFTLRKGVRFQDDSCFPGGKGRELSSADVVYSLKRYADAKVNTVSFDVFEGLVKGIDAFHQASGKDGFKYDANDIDGIRILDSHRFTIDFSVDSPINLYRLAFAYIIPREAVEFYGKDFGQHPVGTGAYALKEYSRRGTLTLASRPAFYRIGSGIDRIEMPLMEEAQPRLLRFLAGQLDYMRADLDTYTAYLEKTANGYQFRSEDHRKKFKVESNVSESSTFLRFSFKDSLLGSNRKLRQAIATAISGRSFAELMYKGTGLPGESIVSPALPGNAVHTGSRWYEHDLQKARQLLAEAGFPQGKGLPEIKFSFGTATLKSRRAFEFFRNELALVGIKAVPVFYQTYGALAKDLESGNFQIAFLAWTPYYPDAENLYNLFSSKGFANYGAYRNSEFDQLYAQSKHMPNGPQRYKQFARMNEILKDDVAFAMPIFRKDLFIGQTRLANFKTQSFEAMRLR